MLSPLPALKKALGIRDETQDDELAILLEAAESAIGQMYELPTVGLVTESRTLFADGAYLPLTECVSVDSVTDTDGNDLAHTTVRAKESDEHLRNIRLRRGRTGSVVVEGEWGYASTPSDVVKATVETAKTWYRRDNLGDGGNDYIGRLDAIPKVAHDLMKARRRVMS
jgi:hypothetical protein